MLTLFIADTKTPLKKERRFKNNFVAIDLVSLWTHMREQDNIFNR